MFHDGGKNLNTDKQNGKIKSYTEINTVRPGSM